MNAAPVITAPIPGSTSPTNLVPPGIGSPIINLPPQSGITPQYGGMFRNFGQPTDPTPTINDAVTFTALMERLKKAADAGVDAVTGLPNRVYGNRPGLRDEYRLR